MKARTVRRHLVTVKPASNRDTSGVLCVRAGDGRIVNPRETPFRHGWTLNKDAVNCPRCLEWMHA